MAKQPDGALAPVSGNLPDSVLLGAENRDFGLYLHVPFCTVRCGYCDFNTYTAKELAGTSRKDYVSQLISELELADTVMRKARLPKRKVKTIFFGGGTPTLLPASDLVRPLAWVSDHWGIARGAEVTVEANPDTVSLDYFRVLQAGGVNRVSIGMQSAVPSVLKILDRSHDPDSVAPAVTAARELGLQVSLDLIYGTPGETIQQWRQSLETAIGLHPDHISTYALIVEEGTKLARQIRRGEVPSPSDDFQAECYELADQLLPAAGYDWYELSNWAKSEDKVSKHNLAYWQDQDWWGAGPGAHSHIGGVRWWNAKHPSAWARRLAEGNSPAVAREELDDEQRYLEKLLLRGRIRAGLPIAELAEAGKKAIAGLIADELVEGKPALAGILVLTLRGRLLADLVVQKLIGE